MKNTPITGAQVAKLKKGFYATPFANRKTRRKKPDSFEMLKRAVQKRKECAKQNDFGLKYIKARIDILRFAAKCYPKHN